MEFNFEFDAPVGNTDQPQFIVFASPPTRKNVKQKNKQQYATQSSVNFPQPAACDANTEAELQLCRKLDFPARCSDVQCLEAEVETGHKEYKLMLKRTIKPDRFQQLVTQMKYRLAQGDNHCQYYIGVEDDGYPKGLSQHLLEQSLDVLFRMATQLNADLGHIQVKNAVNGRYIAVVNVHTKQIQTLNFTDLRVTVCGSYRSGKSSLLSVLAQGEEGTPALDDGKGGARTFILRHAHEVKTGRTSCISQTLIYYDKTGHVLNYAHVASLTKCEMSNQAHKVVTLIDVPGHSKAQGTSLYGLTGMAPDVALVCESAYADSLSATSKLYLALGVALQLQVVVVITQADRGNKGKVEKVISSIQSVVEDALQQCAELQQTSQHISVPVITSNEDVDKIKHLFTHSYQDYHARNAETDHHVPDLQLQQKLQQQSSKQQQQERYQYWQEQDCHTNGNVNIATTPLNHHCIPIVVTSSVDGQGISVLHYLMFNIPPRQTPPSPYQLPASQSRRSSNSDERLCQQNGVQYGQLGGAQPLNGLDACVDCNKVQVSGQHVNFNCVRQCNKQQTQTVGISQALGASSTHYGSTQNGSTLNGSTLNGSTLNGSTLNVSQVSSSVNNGKGSSSGLGSGNDSNGSSNELSSGNDSNGSSNGQSSGNDGSGSSNELSSGNDSNGSSNELSSGNDGNGSSNGVLRNGYNPNGLSNGVGQAHSVPKQSPHPTHAPHARHTQAHTPLPATYPAHKDTYPRDVVFQVDMHVTSKGVVSGKLLSGTLHVHAVLALAQGSVAGLGGGGANGKSRWTQGLHRLRGGGAPQTLTSELQLVRVQQIRRAHQAVLAMCAGQCGTIHIEPIISRPLDELLCTSAAQNASAQHHSGQYYSGQCHSGQYHSGQYHGVQHQTMCSACYHHGYAGLANTSDDQRKEDVDNGTLRNLKGVSGKLNECLDHMDLWEQPTRTPDLEQCIEQIKQQGGVVSGCEQPPASEKATPPPVFAHEKQPNVQQSTEMCTEWDGACVSNQEHGLMLLERSVSTPLLWNQTTSGGGEGSGHKQGGITSQLLAQQKHGCAEGNSQGTKGGSGPKSGCWGPFQRVPNAENSCNAQITNDCEGQRTIKGLSTQQQGDQQGVLLTTDACRERCIDEPQTHDRTHHTVPQPTPSTTAPSTTIPPIAPSAVNQQAHSYPVRWSHPSIYPNHEQHVARNDHRHQQPLLSATLPSNSNGASAQLPTKPRIYFKSRGALLLGLNLCNATTESQAACQSSWATRNDKSAIQCSLSARAGSPFAVDSSVKHAPTLGHGPAGPNTSKCNWSPVTIKKDGGLSPCAPVPVVCDKTTDNEPNNRCGGDVVQMCLPVLGMGVWVLDVLLVLIGGRWPARGVLSGRWPPRGLSDSEGDMDGSMYDLMQRGSSNKGKVRQYCPIVYIGHVRQAARVIDMYQVDGQSIMSSCPPLHQQNYQRVLLAACLLNPNSLHNAQNQPVYTSDQQYSPSIQPRSAYTLTSGYNLHSRTHTISNASTSMPNTTSMAAPVCMSSTRKSDVQPTTGPCFTDRPQSPGGCAQLIRAMECQQGLQESRSSRQRLSRGQEFCVVRARLQFEHWSEVLVLSDGGVVALYEGGSKESLAAVGVVVGSGGRIE